MGDEGEALRHRAQARESRRPLSVAIISVARAGPHHRATPASAAAAASYARILRRTSVVIRTRPPRCGDPLRREPQVTSTLLRRAVSSTFVALILTLALPAAPARAMTGTITGKVV